MVTSPQYSNSSAVDVAEYREEFLAATTIRYSYKLMDNASFARVKRIVAGMQALACDYLPISPTTHATDVMNLGSPVWVSPPWRRRRGGTGGVAICAVKENVISVSFHGGNVRLGLCKYPGTRRVYYMPSEDDKFYTPAGRFRSAYFDRWLEKHPGDQLCRERTFRTGYGRGWYFNSATTCGHLVQLAGAQTWARWHKAVIDMLLRIGSWPGMIIHINDATGFGSYGDPGTGHYNVDQLVAFAENYWRPYTPSQVPTVSVPKFRPRRMAALQCSELE